MVNFSDVVAVSRDAQLRQAEREKNDLAFVEDVMQMVAQQIEEAGGILSATGEWTRISENTLSTFLVTFPEGCNVQEVYLGVGGHAETRRDVFMVGPTGRSLEPIDVKDRAEAVDLVMAYLMDVVTEARDLRRR